MFNDLNQLNQKHLDISVTLSGKQWLEQKFAIKYNAADEWKTNVCADSATKCGHFCVYSEVHEEHVIGPQKPEWAGTHPATLGFVCCSALYNCCPAWILISIQLLIYYFVIPSVKHLKQQWWQIWHYKNLFIIYYLVQLQTFSTFCYSHHENLQISSIIYQVHH